MSRLAAQAALPRTHGPNRDRHGLGRNQDGALLALAQTQFDVFITGDKNLTKQQNLVNLSLAIIVLDAPTNRLVDSLALLPPVLAELATIQPGVLVVVKL
jgi:hypothetical protein